MPLTLHSRTLPVRDAENEALTFFFRLADEHQLTWGEVSRILHSIGAEFAKHQIREERHPDDPEKKGDEA